MFLNKILKNFGKFDAWSWRLDHRFIVGVLDGVVGPQRVEVESLDRTVASRGYVLAGVLIGTNYGRNFLRCQPGRGLIEPGRGSQTSATWVRTNPWRAIQESGVPGIKQDLFLGLNLDGALNGSLACQTLNAHSKWWSKSSFLTFFVLKKIIYVTDKLASGKPLLLSHE